MTSRGRHLLVIGAVLAAGWGAAGAVYLTAQPDTPDADVEEMRQSKQYAREIERIGGKGAALSAELDESLSSLFHGKNLAWTIAGLTAAAAIAYAGASGAFRGSAHR